MVACNDLPKRPTLLLQSDVRGFYDLILKWNCETCVHFGTTVVFPAVAASSHCHGVPPSAASTTLLSVHQLNTPRPFSARHVDHSANSVTGNVVRVLQARRWAGFRLVDKDSWKDGACCWSFLRRNLMHFLCPFLALGYFNFSVIRISDTNYKLNTEN